MIATTLLTALLAAGEAPPAAPPPPGEKAPPAAAALDFDLFADRPPPPGPPPPDPAEVSRRRTMLKLHQGFGIGTEVLTAAGVILGQLDLNDLHEGGAGSRDWRVAHRVVSYAALAAFATTASLSLFAPEPYEKRSGFDAATLHKIAVTVASVGMATQLALGFIAARRAEDGKGRNLDDLVDTHQVVGYATLGTLAVASAVWIF